MTNELTNGTGIIKKTDILKVSFDMLRIVEGFNQREDYGNIEELALSILENGLRNPLSGYKKDGLCFLTDGHRRYEAIKLIISWGKDPGLLNFLPEPKGYNEDERYFDQIIKNDGLSYSPLELGKIYRRFVLKGWDITSIAKKVGKTYQYVSKMIDVASAPQEVINEIKAGTISASLVGEIQGRVKDENELTEVIQVAKEIAKESGKEKITMKDIKPILPETKSEKEKGKEEKEKTNKVNTLKDLTEVLNLLISENTANLDVDNNLIGILVSIKNFTTKNIDKDILVQDLKRALKG